MILLNVCSNFAYIIEISKIREAVKHFTEIINDNIHKILIHLCKSYACYNGYVYSIIKVGTLKEKHMNFVAIWHV